MRKTVIVIRFLVWIICSIIALNLGYYCISAPNTLLNILGASIIAFIAIITWDSECFTNFKFKKNEN